MKYISNSPEQTEKIAYDFAKTLSGGEVITLDGDLGAGKTAFVRGLASGLGIRDIVSSPTFTIVNEYHNGDIPLFHGFAPCTIPFCGGKVNRFPTGKLPAFVKKSHRLPGGILLAISLTGSM